MSLFDDELRRLQQIKARNDALEQAQLAEQNYNNQMAQAQANLDMAQSRPSNPLESVLSGIGNSIANVGKTLVDIPGTTIANWIDLAQGKNLNAEGSNTQEWKKSLYGGENAKDRYAKTAGTALDAAATVSDLIPGLGTAGKVALNVGQGVASGAAQNYIDNGANASLEDTLKGAGIGAASAGVGQLVGGKLASKTAGNGAISKALNSNIGKAALTGAASGATGGGLSAALNGGNALSGALQGAQGGALAGGVMAGAMGLAGAGLDRLNNKVNGVDVDQNTIKTPVAQELTDESEMATGWGDKNMTNSAKKRNALQKFGDTLYDTGQKTQDQAITSKLKGNLADDIASKNSVQRLRDIGFEPSDYDKAANLSEVANKWYDDQVKASKVKLDMPDTYKLADDAAYYRQLSPDMAEKLKMDITKRLDAVRATGGGLSTFDAAGLEKVAKGLGQDVEKMTTTNYGGSKKRINNLSAEAEAYANALNDVKLGLRSKVDDMTDYNPTSLRKVLKNAGATDQQIDYLTDAKSMAAVKRNTSLLEDARNMYRQAKSSPLKRGANADASTNFTTQVANASGLSGLLNMAAEPVGKVVGKIEKGVGKAISGAGDIVGGQPSNIASKLGSKATSLVDALGNDTLSSASYAGVLPTFGQVMTSQLARQAGIGADRALNTQADIQDAQQQAQQAQNDYNSAMTQAQTAYDNAQAMAAENEAGTGNARLDQIAKAMDLALAAGDIKSYGELASLYQTAYKMYAPQLESAAQGGASNLNATQQNNLAKLESAGSAIDQLEQLYNQAGGGQGRFGGKIAELGANMGMNSAASAYNSASRGLINQIAAAVGKTDSLNTEGEVQRALDLVPKITDTPEEAQVKLQSLRSMLAANKKTYQNIYGVSQ